MASTRQISLKAEIARINELCLGDYEEMYGFANAELPASLELLKRAKIHFDRNEHDQVKLLAQEYAKYIKLKNVTVIFTK